MADTITASKTLDIGIEYGSADEQNRKLTTTIKLKNFKSNVTESQIKTAFDQQNVLIYGYDGNNNPQPVTPENIYTASTTNQTINNIDVGWED